MVNYLGDDCAGHSHLKYRGGGGDISPIPPGIDTHVKDFEFWVLLFVRKRETK